MYKRWPEIKIIIYSAYGEFDYAKQALEANAVSYLLKPIEIEEFQKLMVSVIQAINDDNKKDELKQNAEIQNRKNLFYKIFNRAHIAADDREKVNQILFEQSNIGCKLLDVEFAENFLRIRRVIYSFFENVYGEKMYYILICIRMKHICWFKKKSILLETSWKSRQKNY